MKTERQIAAAKRTSDQWLERHTDPYHDGMLTPLKEREFRKEEGWQEALAWVLSDRGAE